MPAKIGWESVDNVLADYCETIQNSQNGVRIKDFLKRVRPEDRRELTSLLNTSLLATRSLSAVNNRTVSFLRNRERVSVEESQRGKKTVP